MTSITLEKKIFGSLVHTQGDTVLAYTDAVSHQADALGMIQNGIEGVTLPKEYATLLFMYNPENQRYTFIHYQGSHVVFPQNARHYTTRCIYEIHKEDMESLNCLYSHIIKALPRMKRQENLELNVSKELNIEKQLPYSYNQLSHEERMIYRHILASIANNTQLWIQLDNQYSDYIENELFHSPKLNAILKAIDALPRELRTYTSLAFSTNGSPKNLIEQSLIVAYHENPYISIDNRQGIHLDWSQEALISHSSPSVNELKHVPLIAPLIPSFIGNVAPYRSNVFKLISLIKKNIDKVIELDINEMTENNITLCRTVSKGNSNIYRYEEIIDKLADCMINNRIETTLEEFNAFVEEHPHLQNQTRIIQYLSKEIDKKKEQLPVPSELEQEKSEEQEIPIWDKELVQKIQLENKRYLPIKEAGFIAFFRKHKKVFILSIILLLTIIIGLIYNHVTQTQEAIEPTISSPNDTWKNDSLFKQPVDSINYNLSTPNQTL